MPDSASRRPGFSTTRTGRPLRCGRLMARVLCAAHWIWIGLFLAPLSAAQAEEPAIPPALTPPSIVHLVPLQLPSDAGLPSDTHLDVGVVIEPDGNAHVDQTLDPPSLQQAVTAALAQSRFQPATTPAGPLRARVVVRLPLVSPQAGAPTALPAASLPEATLSLQPAQAPAVPVVTSEPIAPPSTFGASARVSQLPPTATAIQLQEVRELPGTFGDPFRVLETLPGVVPHLSGLPYVYVRGAPPAGTLYFYDGIQVPGMFHLALGPAVVHPALIDEMNFYASVAPARFGRFTGGVLSGGPAPRPALTRTSGELELRMIDVMGKVDVPVLGGGLSVSGRYGYPGPVISLFSPQTSLNYWDYQTRLWFPVSPHARFELVWFGSFDRAGFVDSRRKRSDFALEFHRAEARLIQRVGAVELGGMLQLGLEHSQIDTSMRVRALRLGPRVYASYQTPEGVRLRVGADMFGNVGSLFTAPTVEGGPIQVRVPVTDGVAARSVMGAYAELSVPLLERLRVELGVRGDLWLTGSRAEAAADPRLTLSYRSHDTLTWHAAFGLAHQPAVFLLPLPGIADVGLEHGLQSAVQSEAGVAIDLPAALKLESQVYVQHFSNMILPELALDQTANCAQLPAQVAMATSRCNTSYPRSSVWAYGFEVFLRRSISEAMSGWINYTLGWARGLSAAGQSFTPTFDVRHVLNLVLQYRLGGGFSTSARVQYRSGKSANELFLRAEPIRYEQRLPGFFRADMSVSYGWRPSWGSLRVTFEWFNVTLSSEATDIACLDGVGASADPLSVTPCPVKHAPALFFPNLGIRAEL